MSINKVILSGRLTADPELRSTGTGVSVMNVNIAVDDGYGENKKTYFPKIVIWRSSAEFVSRYGKKGDVLFVEGRLTINPYEKDGVTRYDTEIVAENVELHSKSRTEEATENNVIDMPPVDEIGGMGADDDLPF